MLLSLLDDNDDVVAGKVNLDATLVMRQSA
jgi:hypothetical protein